MRLWIVLTAVGASCYRAPVGVDPCAIECGADSSCPDGLVCDGRFCHEAGKTCHPTFGAVGAGTGFACAIDQKGVLWCWGANAHHQIDPGAQLAFPYATRIAEGPWTAIDGGGAHVCGIKNGELYCWGINDHGQAAVDSTGTDVATPTLLAVPGASPQWDRVAAGLDYTCAIGGGQLYCWGYDTRGMLGNGMVADADFSPMPVMSTITDWTEVAAGETHTCAISRSAGVFCWGANPSGQLGPNGPTTPFGVNPGLPPIAPAPVAVPLSSPAVSIAVSLAATCAALADGTLWCWGSNSNGELGDLNTAIATTSPTPVMATATTGWTAVAASQRFLCGLHGDAIGCWGHPLHGGMGDGFWDESTLTTKKLANVATGASAIALGWSDDLDSVIPTFDDSDLELACALFGGDIKCWGDDSFGQLGNGAATQTSTPTLVHGPPFSSLAVGAEHACAIDNGGALYCWGSTVSGQATGVAFAGSTRACDGIIDCDVAEPKAILQTPTVDQVIVGTDYTCQRANGAATCWGANYAQQCNAPPNPPRPHTFLGPASSPWTNLLATGSVGTCGLVGSGQAFCWGVDPISRTIVTTTAEASVNTATQVLESAATSCLLSGGQLSCGGDNTYGEFGDGTLTSQPMHAIRRAYTKLAMNGAGSHACGIAPPDQHVECWGRNDRGQTGDAIDPSVTPFAVGLAPCTDIAITAFSSCALCGNTVSCWGDDARGQLGDGRLPTYEVQATPRAVVLPANQTWVELGAGDVFTCARSMAGAVACWGFAPHAGLGNGSIPANLPSLVRAAPAAM